MAIRIAALCGLAGVILLAGLSHWFDLPEKEARWVELAALMLLGHAGPLLVLAGRKRQGIAFWMMATGLGLFSGTLIVLAFAGSLGSLYWFTPLGGLAIIVGWGLVIAQPGR